MPSTYTEIRPTTYDDTAAFSTSRVTVRIGTAMIFQGKTSLHDSSHTAIPDGGCGSSQSANEACTSI